MFSLGVTNVVVTMLAARDYNVICLCIRSISLLIMLMHADSGTADVKTDLVYLMWGHIHKITKELTKSCETVRL